MFDPNTYTWENYFEKKDELYGKKNEIFAAGAMMVPVVLFYLSRRRVRIQRAKKEYYLN
jgi:hypothetical protein